MRDRNLLHLFLALNVALAAAFVTYLFLSNNSQPKVVATDFSKAQKTNLQTRLGTNAPVLRASAPTNAAPATRQTNTPAVAAAPTNAAPVAVFTQKKFDWNDVEKPEYVRYTESLRAVGCPEEKVRNIILADVDELFQHKKLKLALEHDQQWWKPQSEYLIVNVMQERGRALEEERQVLTEKLLGTDVAAEKHRDTLLWNSVQLTGPVLGNLSPQLHNQVQEICGDSISRHQAYFWERANQGQPLNNVEMASLREHTRSELRKILGPLEVEEFVLRYSHNASQLREELRAMDPTPDEFRKVFRATDPLDHQMQMEFGGVEAMSEKQRERYQKDRESAIRDALGTARFQAYLLTKDPLYRQAQMTALQYGAPKAILPIYEMAKVSESKRQKILRDATLSPQQRIEALNALNLEQQRSVQQIVSDSARR
jgi:hypothetical protein